MPLQVTGRRLWKNVYDELGGSPGSTSAATCTRRHYERCSQGQFQDGPCPPRGVVQGWVPENVPWTGVGQPGCRLLGKQGEAPAASAVHRSVQGCRRSEVLPVLAS